MKITLNPYKDCAGFVASRRSGKEKGYVVIYRTLEAGLDVEAGKYVVSCETHKTLVNVTTLASAKSAMSSPDFCEACTKEIK